MAVPAGSAPGAAFSSTIMLAQSTAGAARLSPAWYMIGQAWIVRVPAAGSNVRSIPMHWAQVQDIAALGDLRNRATQG